MADDEPLRSQLAVIQAEFVEYKRKCEIIIAGDAAFRDTVFQGYKFMLAAMADGSHESVANFLRNAIAEQSNSPGNALLN